jgi:hypothetical protein
MGDLEKALPNEIADLAIRSGAELVLPLEQAKWAVRIASQNLIAVLGVEVFRILRDGFSVETYRFGTETYSGYEVKFDGNWQEYVSLNNEAAARFIDENSFGEGYGYILTSTSENELRELGLK